MTSRILVISVNRECSPQPTVPIGAAWVAEALHASGFHVEFLDLCFTKAPMKLLADTVATFNPEGIAISVRNLDNCDFFSPRSYLPEIRQITDRLKSLCSARILIGGAGVSIMPEQILDYLELDHAVVGEGEHAAARFFRSRTSREVCSISGLKRRGERGLPAACHESGAEALFVMPRTHRWVDTRKYLNYEPVLPVQTKRGCANRCLYCTYNRIEGERWRLREPSAVIEEISGALRESGAREFEFVDSVFNQPEGYLEMLLEEIIKRRLKAGFRVSSLSPGGLTLEQVRMMERSGITSVVITPESVADETLEGLNKNFGEADVMRAADLFRGSAIRVLWCFLIGGPNECVYSLKKTTDFINNCTNRKDSVYITAGIRIYPGTVLQEIAVKEGIVAPADSLLQPSFYFTPGLAPQRAMELLRNGLVDSTRCIFPSDTECRALGPIRRLGTMLRLPGPYWRYARYLHRFAGKSRVINRSWTTHVQ